MKTLPSIVNSEEKEKEVVEELSKQVGKLLSESKMPNFKASMATVLFHRYNGRFRRLYRKVAKHLSECSADKRRQMTLSLGA